MTPTPRSHPQSHPRTGRRRLAVAATAAVCATAAAGVWFAAGSASAGTISGALYKDTDTAVARWLAANPNDSRASVRSIGGGSVSDALGLYFGASLMLPSPMVIDFGDFPHSASRVCFRHARFSKKFYFLL